MSSSTAVKKKIARRGVIIENKLKFEDNIGENVKKANMIVSLAKEAFNHLGFKLFKTLSSRLLDSTI